MAGELGVEPNSVNPETTPLLFWAGGLQHHFWTRSEAGNVWRFHGQDNSVRHLSIWMSSSTSAQLVKWSWMLVAAGCRRLDRRPGGEQPFLKPLNRSCLAKLENWTPIIYGCPFFALNTRTSLALTNTSKSLLRFKLVNRSCDISTFTRSPHSVTSSSLTTGPVRLICLIRARK